MLRLLIGSRFGPEPETRIDEIRAERHRHAEHVARRLALEPADIVADLGSGCGFMAAPIAGKVRHLYCLDISEDFAAYCGRETAALANVSVHVMPFADLSLLDGAGVTKVLSHAVFLHLSLFDAALYLRELARILQGPGLLLLDINDIERIDTAKDPAFNKHLDYYRKDRTRIFDLMQWHSVAAFAHVAACEGFELVDQKPAKTGAFTELMLRRRRD